MSTPPIVLGPVFSRAMAAVFLLMGAGLAAISLALLHVPKLEAEADFSMIFPLTFPFSAFFLFLAWRCWQSAGKPEFAPDSHWRRLGFCLLCFALAGTLLWKWVVALFPLVVGGICLMKDRAIGDKIAKVLQWIP